MAVGIRAAIILIAWPPVYLVANILPCPSKALTQEGSRGLHEQAVVAAMEGIALFRSIRMIEQRVSCYSVRSGSAEHWKLIKIVVKAEPLGEDSAPILQGAEPLQETRRRLGY